MTVSQLVKSATGADDVSVIADDNNGNVTVMVARMDAYRRPILTRMDAVVSGGVLVSLGVTGAVKQDADDSEEYRSEYAMGGQW